MSKRWSYKIDAGGLARRHVYDMTLLAIRQTRYLFVFDRVKIGNAAFWMNP
jgi:hypothetical protein